MKKIAVTIVMIFIVISGLHFSAQAQTRVYPDLAVSITSTIPGTDSISDYGVFFSYISLGNVNCKYNRRHVLNIYRDGDSPQDTVYEDRRDTHYVPFSYQLPVGPGSNHQYGLRYREYNSGVGNCDDYSWSGFKKNEDGKWEPYATPNKTERDNLIAQGRYSVVIRAITEPIKSPINVTASDKAFFDRIVLNWSKGTNIPNESHTYRIYRGITNNPAVAYYLGEVEGVVRSWTDSTAVPNDEFYYWITTYTANYLNSSNNTMIHESPRTTQNAVRGSTKTITVKASDGIWPNKVRVDWGDLSSCFTDVKVERSIPNSATERSQVGVILGTRETGCDDSDPVPGCDYTYYVTPIHAPRIFPAYADKGYRKMNGEISGRVTSSQGAGVDNVRVCARLLTAIPPGAVAAPVGGYCAYTDVNGYYTIPDVYYYDRAEFYVTPYKKGQLLVHDFSPDSTRITLAASSPLKTVNFTDVSVFTVSGKVLYPTSSITKKECGIPGVEILKDGQRTGQVTDSNGEWKFSIQNEGTYRFKPVFKHHRFTNAQSQAESQVLVNDDVSNVNFTDTEFDSIQVRVQSGCGTSLARNKAIVQVTSPNLCYFDTIPTDGNGLLTIRNLPARPYEIQVIRLDPLNSNYMAQIGNKPINLDLTVRDTAEVEVNGSKTRVAVQPKAEFIYHSPVDVTIGWEEAGAEVACGNVLMEQHKNYTLYLNVKEQLGGCLVTEGKLKIYDYVSDRGSTGIEVPVKNGTAIYTVNAGIPNTAENEDHKKLLYVMPQIGFLESPPVSFRVMVTGVKTNNPSFVTTSPDFPLLVIHDPPGDSSYCYVSKGFSISSFTRHEVLTGGEAGAYCDLTFGGAGEHLKAGGVFKTTLTGGKDTFDRWGIVNTLTFEERFETDFTQDFIGHEGDVFIGASYNEAFSLADELTFDRKTCTPKMRVIPAVVFTGIETTFIYSEKHIKHTLIPNFIKLYEVTLAGRKMEELPLSEQEEATNYALEADHWENILAQNDANRGIKATSEDPPKNISFSAGTVYSSEYTTDTVRSGSFEYRQLINWEVAAGAKIENDFGFWAETDFGAIAKFRYSYNVDTGDDTTSTRKVGYVLTDRDEGDYYTVDIKRDNAFGVPVFDMKSGTSSCPYEPGTQLRDYPEILITPPEINNVPVGGTANFVASLTNFSQSREPRDYAVKVITNTNTDGALVKLGGSIINNSAVTYKLDFSKTTNVALTVEKGPYATQYGPIGIVMYSPCRWESATSDTAWISIGFQTECSTVSLSSPGDGWLVNQQSNNILNVAFTGYDANDPKLQSITLQYKKDGGDWTNHVTIYKESQTEKFYDYPFDVTALEDGAYRLRTKSYCGPESAISYSPERSGTIDRASIAPFGYPTPSDGRLDPGDEISVTFDKNLNCNLSAAYIKLLTDDNTEIPLTQQCFGNKIILMPLVNFFEGTGWNGVNLYATVKGIKDLSGNIQEYPVNWSFKILRTLSGNPFVCPVPHIQCPGNKTFTNDPGVCGAQVFFPDVTPDKDCGGPGITIRQTAGLRSGYFYPVGVTTNSYVLTNAEGKTSTCSFDVRVYDDEPPLISNLSANLYKTWPLYPGWIPVALNYTATDNCRIIRREIYVRGRETGINISSIKTSVGYMLMDDHHILLAAERSGPGDGREYTIYIRCWDEAGNNTLEKTTIFIPHDKTCLKSTGTNDLSGFTPVNPVFIDEENRNEPFMANVWPNPSNGNFNLEVISSSDNNIEVSVIDILGRLILKPYVAGRHTCSFGENLTPGIYYVSVKQGSNLKNIKVLKQ